MQISQLLSIMTLVAGLTSCINAAPQAIETFDYRNGELHGLKGGDGFSHGWNAPKVELTNNSAILRSTANRASRQLKQPISLDKPLFVAITMLSIGRSKDSVVAPVYLRTAESDYLGSFGISRDSFVLSIGSPAEDKQVIKRIGQHVPGTPVRCVFKLERINDEEVIGKLWVNPIAPEKSEINGFIIGPLSPEIALEKIELRIWTREEDARASFKDLRIGHTWEDVVDTGSP